MEFKSYDDLPELESHCEQLQQEIKELQCKLAIKSQFHFENINHDDEMVRF